MSIFISYRRDNSSHVAQEIFHSLSSEYQIFLDTESLKSGRFDYALVEEIKSCTDFILLVTASTFDRCIEPDDWITNEVQIALLEHKNIIPIFIDTDKFPNNIPTQLEDLYHYNGVHWINKGLAIEKLKLFLLSNRRQILTIVREKQKLILSEETRQNLIAIYRRFHTKGRRPVTVQLEIYDFEDASNILRPDSAALGLTNDEAMADAVQSLKRNFYCYKKTFEIAIEHLLLDETFSIFAERCPEIFIEKYGLINCRGYDENGVEIYYWTPYAWILVIEELLIDIITNRLQNYRLDKSFIPIQCYALSKKRKELYHFPSIIPKETAHNIPPMPLPSPYTTYNPYYDGDRNPNCIDIPPHDLIRYVYPDFYYTVSMIKQGKHENKLEEFENGSGILDLWYLRFGLA